MKKNDLKKRIRSPRSLPEWDELIERYYEGRTTSKEERQLRSFLFSEQAAASCYDEHRAVMSYLALKGRMPQREQEKDLRPRAAPVRRRSRRYRIAAAAVGAGLVAGASLYLTDERNDVFVAYVHGKKYTSAEVVTEESRRSLDLVFSEHISIEQELDHIFCALEKSEYNP